MIEISILSQKYTCNLSKAEMGRLQRVPGQKQTTTTKFCSPNRAVTQSEEESHASHSHCGAVGFSPTDIIPILFCVRTHCVCTMIKHFSEHISVAKQHFTMSPWKFMFSSLWDLVMVLTPRIPLCRLQSHQHPIKSPISRALEP